MMSSSKVVWNDEITWRSGMYSPAAGLQIERFAMLVTWLRSGSGWRMTTGSSSSRSR